MKCICFGYFEKGKFEGMTEGEHAVQLMAQHPGLKYSSVFEIRPAADMSEVMKASEQRRRQHTER